MRTIDFSNATLTNKSPLELRPHPHQKLAPPMSEDEYKELVADVRLKGIDHPLIIKDDGVILDGHHRLRAAREIGLVEVPVIVPDFTGIDEDEYLLSSALNRRNLTEGQRATLAYEYQQLRSEHERKLRAEKAISERWHPNENKSYLEEDVTSKYELKGRTRTESANKFKVSEWKLRQVADIANDKAVYEKVRSGDLQLHEARRIISQPEPMRQEILHQKETEPKKDVRVIIREIHNVERNTNPPELPSGKYAVLYADPPWQYEHDISISRSIENQYPTMSIEELSNLTIPAADDAILFLWSPAPLMEKALNVMKAWGFTYRTNMVWIKDRPGMGWYVRQQHELLLIGSRGNGIGMPTGENKPVSIITAPRTEHSVKPVEVYDIIEHMYPNRERIELFAKIRQNGWEAWGNEI